MKEFQILSALSVFLLCTPLMASAYTDGSGRIYSAARNEHGVVMKSSDYTLSVGNTCEAYSPQLGNGKWGWANGGVSVEFQKISIGFPRVESPFEDLRCRF